jgi:uncharacterized RDD family membrane protein YckC
MTDPFGPGAQPPMPPQQPGTPMEPTAPHQPVMPLAPAAPLDPTAPIQPSMPEFPAPPQQAPGSQPPPGHPTLTPPAASGTPPGFPGQVAAPATPPYAGFGKRLAASLIDGVITMLAIAVVMVPLGIWLAVTFDTEPAGCELNSDSGCQVSDGFVVALIASVAIVILASFLWLIFYQLRPVAKRGQTLGRKLMSIRVLAEETMQAPGWGKTIIRYLVASFLSGSIFYLGYLWVLWDDKKQTWHDKLANTIVVSE